MAGSNALAPGISALVCTADRPDLVVRTVRSILANTHPRFEVIVVDQSAARATADALAAITDPRLRYVPDPQRGKGHALNVGRAAARSAIIACTDDDCTVPATWLQDIQRVFEERPTAAVVFGRVDAAAHDPAAGFVPGYAPVRDRYLRRGVTPDGMGACMAIRNSVIESLGGFDPSFGPGSAFRSGDDRDLALRAVESGLVVYETAAISVIHHGFRTFAEGRSHARRAWFGMGGMCAKLLKTGHWKVGFVAFDLFVVRAVWPIVGEPLRLRRPMGLTRARSFLRGFGRGLRTPVIAGALIFAAASGGALVPAGGADSDQPQIELLAGDQSVDREGG